MVVADMMKEEQQIVLQIEECSSRHLQRPRVVALVGMKRERGEAAERGRIRILLAAWLTEPMDLDLRRELGELVAADQPALVGAERPKERGREAAG